MFGHTFYLNNYPLDSAIVAAIDLESSNHCQWEIYYIIYYYIQTLHT